MISDADVAALRQQGMAAFRSAAATIDSGHGTAALTAQNAVALLWRFSIAWLDLLIAGLTIASQPATAAGAEPDATTVPDGSAQLRPAQPPLRP